MKKQLILTSALSALFPLALSAQSPTATPAVPAIQSIAPVSAAPGTPPVAPAPPAPPRRHIHEHDNGPKEPVTFLGVQTSDVPRVLSEQMNLPKGFGVVVDYVVPDAPAAAAGVQQSDIIRRLNDQQIINPDQLGKLVRSFPEGTSVELTLMRKGQETKVSVKLGQKDVPSRRGRYGDFEQEWNFDDLDKMKFDFKAPDMTAVREAVARAKEQAMQAASDARRAARGLRIVTSDDGLTKSTRIDLGRATITFSDDQGELKMESRDGHKMLMAKDAQGKVLFNGPIDTDEQRAALPENVRERFEKLERQELPEVPVAPEAPEAPQPPEPNESAQLQSARGEKAVFRTNHRTGWRRSTFVL